MASVGTDGQAFEVHVGSWTRRIKGRHPQRRSPQRSFASCSPTSSGRELPCDPRSANAGLSSDSGDSRVGSSSNSELSTNEKITAVSRKSGGGTLLYTDTTSLETVWRKRLPTRGRATIGKSTTEDDRSAAKTSNSVLATSRLICVERGQCAHLTLEVVGSTSRPQNLRRRPTDHGVGRHVSSHD